MVNVILGGIFCTSTVTVSAIALSRLPRTIVTSPLAFGNAALMPLGTSGNWTIVVGARLSSTCTVGASSPLCTICRRRSASGLNGTLVACRGPWMDAALAAPFVAAVTMLACMAATRNSASRTAPPRIILRLSCRKRICILLSTHFTVAGLKHRRGLPIGHGLGTGVQRRVAAIERCSFERGVVEYLLSFLQRGEPHPQVLQLDPRSLTALNPPHSGIARIRREGNQRDALEGDLAGTVIARVQISNVLDVSKGLICQFDKEDGKSVEQAHLWISLHDRHNSSSFRKGFLHPAWEEWKLNDHTWRLRGEHLHCRGQLMG